MPAIYRLFQICKRFNRFAKISHNSFNCSLSSSVGPLARTNAINNRINLFKLAPVFLNNSRRQPRHTTSPSNDSNILIDSILMICAHSINKLPTISQINIIKFRWDTIFYNFVIGILKRTTCIDDYTRF